ncbi:hypothetical protein BZA05DRAFT_229813 [Tricharina praecox]|uniref:uncharacterized protein n=1 Tax=Tricharina praecox TaxID=43433 RepID=UPI00221E55AC|nr:uncharacterized protein BZA05DRAFT_229813 [Tricharina praecox]KAI5841238.1 hypothetical protein BZA05DRAFT_229813 [Tricharina praecox]
MVNYAPFSAPKSVQLESFTVRPSYSAPASSRPEIFHHSTHPTFWKGWIIVQLSKLNRVDGWFQVGSKFDAQRNRPEIAVAARVSTVQCVGHVFADHVALQSGGVLESGQNTVQRHKRRRKTSTTTQNGLSSLHAEIILIVLSNLSRSDFYNLCLVSKLFHTYTTPYLYRSVDIVLSGSSWDAKEHVYNSLSLENNRGLRFITNFRFLPHQFVIRGGFWVVLAPMRQRMYSGSWEYCYQRSAQMYCNGLNGTSLVCRSPRSESCSIRKPSRKFPGASLDVSVTIWRYRSSYLVWTAVHRLWPVSRSSP